MRLLWDRRIGAPGPEATVGRPEERELKTHCGRDSTPLVLLSYQGHLRRIYDSTGLLPDLAPFAVPVEEGLRFVDVCGSYFDGEGEGGILQEALKAFFVCLFVLSYLNNGRTSQKRL